MRTAFVLVAFLQLSVFLWRTGIVVAESDAILELPEDFSIGAGSSSYQVEGAWNLSDKGEGAWDRLAHTKPWLVNFSDGDVACDSFHKYREDVSLVKSLGLNHYRFSLSWSRILPTGTPDKISKIGVQYYHNLIDELLANGIQPFVTIFHFDDVQMLYEKTGGWINESMVEYFADYARIVFKEFGGKVKFWTTINEPNTYCTLVPFVEEPSPPAYTSRYLCAHNTLKAHARAYHIYNDEFRASQNGKIGLTVGCEYFYPKLSHDTNVSKIGFDFETGWITHPIFSQIGGYPDVMIQRIAENSRNEGLKKSRLPEFSPFWIDYIKGSADYLGLNHYTSVLAESVAKINGTWYNDSGIVATRKNDEWVIAANGWAVVPQGLGDVLKIIKKAFGNPPVYILENGYCGQGEIVDKDRISYLYSYMKEVLLAIRNGADVRAYTVWSLMDNFEWMSGYSYKFGLYEVNFKSPERSRVARLSVQWLIRVMAERRLIPVEKNTLENC